MQSLEEVLQRLYELVPAYHLHGVGAYKPGLDNAFKISEYFGHPYKEFPCIHVGGTNGKGSVSHGLASVLQQAGYKVGLYTSPHLVHFNERIKINGTPIEDKFILNWLNNHEKIIPIVQPSFFEITTFLAFDYFKQHQVDYAVIEVGLGGRLDTTNLISPLVSIITNVSYDHQQFLGDTLQQIAYEKAGIIKPLTPVIVGETHPDTQSVFIQNAKSLNAPIKFADASFHFVSKKVHNSYQEIIDIFHNEITFNTDLIGFYQLKNLQTLYTAFLELQKLIPNLTYEHWKEGISHVKTKTGLRGRMDWIDFHGISMLIDVAHNHAGLQELINYLHQTQSDKKWHFILGFVNDKNLEFLEKLLPINACYYLTKPNVPRGLSVEVLANLLPDNAEFTLHNDIRDAIYNLQKSFLNPQHDIVILTGSNFLIADFLKWNMNA